MASSRTLDPSFNPPAYTIVSGLRTFDYNPDLRCGSIAAAILLAYYDDEVDDDIVDDERFLSDGTGEAFSDYLYDEIEGLIPTSYTRDVRNGLDWYLEQVGFDDQYSAASVSDASCAEYSDLIYAGTPVIIDLNDHPSYGEHWVVGYGTDVQVLEMGIYYIASVFAIVNDGHGDNGVYINWDYVGDIVYLE